MDSATSLGFFTPTPPVAPQPSLCALHSFFVGLSWIVSSLRFNARPLLLMLSLRPRLLYVMPGSSSALNVTWIFSAVFDCSFWVVIAAPRFSLADAVSLSLCSFCVWRRLGELLSATAPRLLVYGSDSYVLFDVGSSVFVLRLLTFEICSSVSVFAL